MQSKRSYKQNERNDETKIKSLAMMVKRNTPARPRQKRGASARSEAKIKCKTLHPCPAKHLSLTSYKRPTINIIVCFAKLMHNFWDYANCETL